MEYCHMTKGSYSKTIRSMFFYKQYENFSMCIAIQHGPGKYNTKILNIMCMRQ